MAMGTFGAMFGEIKHLHSKRRRKDSPVGLDYSRRIKFERKSRKKRHPWRMKQT
jgi:hypothetical protein